MAAEAQLSEWRFEPLVTLPYIPAGDAVKAAPRRTHARYMEVRKALIAEVLKDRRVRAKFREWEEQSGLRRAADHVASTLDDLAKHAGVARLEVEQLLEQGWRGDPDCPACAPLMRELVEAQRTLYAGVRHEPFAEDAKAFVRGTLRLRWVFVAVELVRAFHLEMLQAATAKRLEMRPAVSSKVVSEALDVRLHVPKDIATAEALRLIDEHTATVAAYRKRLEGDDLIVTDGPQGVNAEALAMYASWFYRVKIKGESQRAVAADVGKQPVDIRDGMARVEELLDLAVFTMP